MTVVGCPDDSRVEIWLLCTGLGAPYLYEAPSELVLHRMVYFGLGGSIPAAPTCAAPCETLTPGTISADSSYDEKTQIAHIHIVATSKCKESGAGGGTTGAGVSMTTEVTIYPPPDCPAGTGAKGFVHVWVTIRGKKGKVADPEKAGRAANAQERQARDEATRAAAAQSKADMCPFANCQHKWPSGVPQGPSVTNTDNAFGADNDDGTFSAMYGYTFEYTCTGATLTKAEDDKRHMFGTSRRLRSARSAVERWRPTPDPFEVVDVGSIVAIARAVLGTSVATSLGQPGDDVVFGRHEVRQVRHSMEARSR